VRSTDPYKPDLGEHTVVFEPDTPAASVQQTLDRIAAEQHTNQFGPQRHALLFAPGEYKADLNLGFYTQVAGLGLLPDDTSIAGHIRVEADWLAQDGDPGNTGNGTQNFWRAAENLAVTVPDGEVERWAVSQASPYRRMHLRGPIQLWNGSDGWASGGLIADSRIDGVVESGTQQQFLTRNSELTHGWTGANWNMVFVGTEGAPPHQFPEPAHTTIESTPLIREKPFLHRAGDGEYQVFVPGLRSATRGPSWTGGEQPGRSVSLREFFVAKPDDPASLLNDALAEGKHLLFTPGIYEITEPVAVTRPGTVLLGLGLATLIPVRGTAALRVSDVDGVTIAGLLVDAGPERSPVLVEIGEPGCTARHTADPVLLSDLFVRVGGAGAGAADVSLTIHSNDVLADHLWLWRADHGDGVGWEVNPADHGLVVHGHDITIYGLFVEHYQRENVLWHGERGRTYFFQNELPYDPPDNKTWPGFPAYVVADSVREHRGWGLGSYCYFLTNPRVSTDRAFAVPDTPEVALHGVVTVSLGGGVGAIRHMVNDVGPQVDGARPVSHLSSYPQA
jgi:hypothetical protein